MTDDDCLEMNGDSGLHRALAKECTPAGQTIVGT